MAQRQHRSRESGAWPSRNRPALSSPVSSIALVVLGLASLLVDPGSSVARSPASAQGGNSGITISGNSEAVTTAAIPTKVTFAAVSFAELPGWAEDDHLAALKTFLVSCPRLTTVAAGDTTDRSVRPPGLLAACEAALELAPQTSRAEARAFFERHFTPEKVVHSSANGLLTGYYEPLIEGSRTRQARFESPILRRPADLVNLVEEASRGTLGRQLSHARKTAAGIVPFATRAEIDAGALAGQNLELLYLADAVDVFFLQIQGSGRIKLTDGRTIRVQYDGKNGHPYTSIGRYLIDEGLLAADKVTMAALGRWLRADAGRARMVMHQNASYVFFREMPAGAEGPLGVLDIPLTSGRSLAVDTSVHTLGAPIYVSAPTLTHALNGRPYNRLMVAQDVGSAIRGPERGDIYFGSGKAAGRLAGVTKHPGHLFVLRAKVPGHETVQADGQLRPGGRPRAVPKRTRP